MGLIQNTIKPIIEISLELKKIAKWVIEIFLPFVCVLFIYYARSDEGVANARLSHKKYHPKKLILSGGMFATTVLQL